MSGSADQHVPFGVLRVDVSAIVGQVSQGFCAHLVFTLVQVVQADLVRLREIQECHLQAVLQNAFGERIFLLLF